MEGVITPAINYGLKQPLKGPVKGPSYSWWTPDISWQPSSELKKIIKKLCVADILPIVF